ncbi:hypothetical protein BY996DRAFT_6415775 [Phakopsora pachyrhizi]|uniref:Expressed protein n=1 Tax=Phakopsora pachyrhizi TaxID=170000 RepID=A0AAV0AU27_PHAPC|nr:hypothetical protein BY996DRAFT_6415775 [Phakopsora pachyrhizi]CAH7673181.1 expressed protein [Phakopsora pachyrhizi]
MPCFIFKTISASLLVQSFLSIHGDCAVIVVKETITQQSELLPEEIRNNNASLPVPEKTEPSIAVDINIIMDNDLSNDGDSPSITAVIDDFTDVKDSQVSENSSQNPKAESDVKKLDFLDETDSPARTAEITRRSFKMEEGNIYSPIVEKYDAQKFVDNLFLTMLKYIIKGSLNSIFYKIKIKTGSDKEYYEELECEESECNFDELDCAESEIKYEETEEISYEEFVFDESEENLESSGIEVEDFGEKSHQLAEIFEQLEKVFRDFKEIN